LDALFRRANAITHAVHTLFAWIAYKVANRIADPRYAIYDAERATGNRGGWSKESAEDGRLIEGIEHAMANA
jgi:hypothetical protein